MTSYVQNKPQKPILVFLAKDAARDIVSKLNENGHVATAVSSVPELFDALRSERYFLAVTMRSDIDMIRRIKPIPIVNIEVFFHSVQSKSVSPSKEFDSDAFVRRIGTLTETRANRISAVQTTAAVNEAVMAGAAKASRWRAATSLLLSRRAAPSAGRTD